MKRFISILTLLVALVAISSCTHKELCDTHSSHAHRYHMNVIADYRLDWEENITGYRNWQASWIEGYIPYDDLRPTTPAGLRVISFDTNGNHNVHNISATGGVVSLYAGENDLLFYNNDTEYIVFSRNDSGATTRASTRAVTRATYSGNIFAEEDEKTVNAPDMLFANFVENYIAHKTLSPVDFSIELQPLVYTYKIRYEFAEGLKYVALARGALSGMAESVQMDTGETSETGATILFDCEITDFGARSLVKSFGIPGYPNPNYPTTRATKHGLNLEVMLRNGNMVNFEFDVTDQVNNQPHGGVIVVKDIVINEKDGTQGSGSFDVAVDDWGPYQDVPLPLF